MPIVETATMSHVSSLSSNTKPTNICHLFFIFSFPTTNSCHMGGQRQLSRLNIFLFILLCQCIFTQKVFSKADELDIVDAPIILDVRDAHVALKDVSMVHALTLEQRRRIRKLTQEIREKSETLEVTRTKLRNAEETLQQRRSEYYNVMDRLKRYNDCIALRKEILEKCRDPRYFRQNQKLCQDRRTCGNKGRLSRTARDKLRLFQSAKKRVESLRSDFLNLKLSITALQDKVRRIINQGKPRPSNSPRSSLKISN